MVLNIRVAFWGVPRIRIMVFLGSVLGVLLFVETTIQCTGSLQHGP